MELILKPLGCEVRGVDLKTENRPESNVFVLLSFIVGYHCSLRVFFKLFIYISIYPYSL